MTAQDTIRKLRDEIEQLMRDIAECEMTNERLVRENVSLRRDLADEISGRKER